MVLAVVMLEGVCVSVPMSEIVQEERLFTGVFASVNVLEA
jgi:hypothetical protein